MKRQADNCRVLFVLHERNLGGASRSAVTLMQELRERGHEVFAVLPIRQGQVYPRLRELGIPAYVIFFGWQEMPSYWNPFFKLVFRLLYATEGFAIRRIARIIRREKIQIVHSNSSVIDTGARAAALCGVPHVWHVREYGDLHYHFEFLKGQDAAYKAMAAIPGKMVFISRGLRNHYAIPLPEENRLVIYNGVSASYCIRKNREKTGIKRSVVFLITGNLQPSKEQITAIRACQILTKRGYRGFRLVIAGAATALADSHRYEEKLRDAAASLPDGLVRFAGYCEDMKPLREEADVELVCSTGEAFGRVSVEAMLASNPVIGARSGATPEIIEDGVTGFLFTAGDADDLADRMSDLIREPDRIAVLGDAAFTRAKQMFLSEKNTDQIETLYQSLLLSV